MSTLVHLPILDLRQLDCLARRPGRFSGIVAMPREDGIFHLTGHGIDPELQQGAAAVAGLLCAASGGQTAGRHDPLSPFSWLQPTGAEATRVNPTGESSLISVPKSPCLAARGGRPALVAFAGAESVAGGAADTATRADALAWADDPHVLYFLLGAFAEALALSPDAFDALRGVPTNISS